MKPTNYVSLVISKLNFDIVRYYPSDVKHSHYTLVTRDGRKIYFILTNRVLRYPLSMDINYRGAMLGINRDVLYEIIRDGTYVAVMWGVKGDLDNLSVFFVPIKRLAEYTKPFSRYENTTCRRVRGSEKYVCHYPVERAVFLGVVGQQTLDKFLGDRR